ncbi:hypothetical protein HNE_3202 [Hyphomonas neptunium ATCC 15444]|uniref:Uncharacterized protein n=1 Tax=Hyphomonas neptunium (strain ATCC 15444) TaxID=228405 RepID=Q0BXB6_HYPNA|nr:hypothetical protein HNE_3202 [Hyphomonas neptunium ATCC 15444]
MKSARELLASGQPYDPLQPQQQQGRREEYAKAVLDMAPCVSLSAAKAKKSVIRPPGFPVESAGNKDLPGLCILTSP